jgi:SAM-dependent methyltransferase
MESAYAKAGLRDVDYWGKRAKSYRQALHERMDEDPFFLHVREHVTQATTVLDVGAGTGRHTMALAPLVARVTAVEPSAAMRGLLEDDVRERNIQNVGTVAAEWMDADVEPADVVICSHVLYPIADVVPFIEKLERHARERVFVYLRVDPLPTDMGLWSEFHGEPLQHQPVHMDLLNAMAQVGIYPDVLVGDNRFTWTFRDLDEATAQVRNGLCLREDDDAAITKLHALLSERLASMPDGRIGQEAGNARSAIISWPPRQ